MFNKYFFLIISLTVSIFAFDTITSTARDHGMVNTAAAIGGADGSIRVNPAGKVDGERSATFQAEMGFFNIGDIILLNIGYYQNLKYLGFGINYINLGAKSLTMAEKLSGTERVLNYNDLLLNTYAGVPDIFRFGINLRIAGENYNTLITEGSSPYSSSLKGAVVDLGTRFNLGKVVRLGASVHSVGDSESMLQGGIGFSFISKPNPGKSYQSYQSSPASMPGRPSMGGGAGRRPPSSGIAKVDKDKDESVESTVNIEFDILHSLSGNEFTSYNTGLELYFTPQFAVRGGFEIGNDSYIAFSSGLTIRVKSFILNYSFKKNNVFNQNIFGVTLDF